MNANAATRKADEVLRLSMAQDYHDLITEADGLWPAYPERIAKYERWVAKADALLGQLPMLETKRDELRSLARPRTEEERRADREGHPEYAELVRARGELLFLTRALTQRRDGEAVELPEVDWGAYPSEAAALGVEARARVGAGRETFGEEALGVALAERAIELATNEERPAIASTLSRGYFALGRDEEALGLAFMALEDVPNLERTRYEGALAELEHETRRARSPDGLASAQAAIAALESRIADLVRRVEEPRRSPKSGQ